MIPKHASQADDLSARLPLLSFIVYAKLIDNFSHESDITSLKKGASSIYVEHSYKLDSVTNQTSRP